MPKVKKPTKRNDILLAVMLGIVVTGIGVFVTRYSSASSNASFRRDPITQMQGGKIVRKTLNQKARLASSPAPGVDPVYTLVSKAEMENTAKVCVQYTVLKPGTYINVSYNSPSQGLSTSPGATKNSGSGTECVDRGGQAVDGIININVTPGSAYINKVYGVLRAYDD